VVGKRLSLLAVGALALCGSGGAWAQSTPAPSQIRPPVITPAPAAPTRIVLPRPEAGGAIPAEASKLHFVLTSGNNGFTFADGTTGIAALLQHGPVMLGKLPSGDQGLAPWLLAIKMTDYGKGIVANDPLTGDQVVLAYDPATKMVGGVTAVLDPSNGKPVPLGTGAPTLSGQKTQVPEAAWSELKAFKPVSYFAVSI